MTYRRIKVSKEQNHQNVERGLYGAAPFKPFAQGLNPRNVHELRDGNREHQHRGGAR